MAETSLIRWLERTFAIRARGSSVTVELQAGATTYLAMCYIILVNPVVLGAAGMEPGSVLTATCFASAIASFWMALHANYPIALAPGMGQNFFFAFTICGPIATGGYGFSWQEGLAAVIVAGLLFVLASLWRLRARLIDCIPEALKASIGVGIGLLIAVVGLRWGGVVTSAPGTYIALGDLSSPEALVTITGLTVAGALTARGTRGALVAGIFVSTLLSLAMGKSELGGVFGLPESMTAGVLAADFRGLFSRGETLTIIFVILFVDLFDTVGTLIGVTERAGLSEDGKLPRAREAFLADAAGSVAGGILGTSTVTSYVESAAGVAAGGRTGLSAVVTGALFAGSVFFYPLLAIVGGSFENEAGVSLYPTIAPALILVGVFMMVPVAKIRWAEPLQSIPAFLTIIMMPLTTSITEGIAFGFTASSALHLLTGRGRELHWLAHVVAGFFMFRFIWL